MSTHQSIPKPANAKKKSDILPIPAQSKSHPVVAQPKIESTRSNEEQLAQIRANREASERMGSTLLIPESVPHAPPPVQPKHTRGQENDHNRQEADIQPQAAPIQSHPVVAQPKIESTRSNEEQLAQMRANREASERLGTTLLIPESVPRTLPPLQPKLTIGQPNDQYEQEADRVARQVVDQINAPPKIQAKTQRYPMSVGQRKPSPLAHHPVSRVQRYATGGEMDASPDLESSIQRARGGGHPLDNGIRARMEGAFGADFSGVRVHTDGTSDQLNQSIQAKAFTTGQDVFFRKGAYEPGSRGGQELLAHELTHVVQQRDSSIQPQVIQRALGLEFQTGWQVYHEQPAFAGKPAHQVEYQKEESIYGDRQNTLGWSMETDGTDIEFVVEPPFPETDAGMVRLHAVMRSLQNFTKGLNAQQNQARLTPQTHPQFFQTRDPYAVIEPQGEIRAQPQATVGVRLDRMEDFFREIGREGDQSDLSSSQGTNYYATEAVDTADLVSNAPQVNGQPPSDRLKGLLTLIIQYLIQGNKQGRRAYAKDIAYAMARTDFVTIFSQIPEAGHFQANPRLWVDYALGCAQLPNTANELLINQKITDGRNTLLWTPNQVNNLPKLPLTRGQWLHEMALGNNAVDRLTQAATLNAPIYTDYKGGNRLRALGLLGNTTDAVGQNNNDTGIILELRQMKREIPSTQWYKVARGLMTYLVALNRSNAGAGRQYTRPN